MTTEEQTEIRSAIDDLNEARTYLHLATMAAIAIGEEDGNALQKICDLASGQLMLVRIELYRLCGELPPCAQREC